MADGWQGRGLGTELMRTLADRGTGARTSIASKAPRWPRMRASPPGHAASASRSAPNRIQAAWSSSSWTFEVPLDQSRDGVIPALAGPCQPRERRIEVPVQLLAPSVPATSVRPGRAPPVPDLTATNLPRLRHRAGHRDSVARRAGGGAESRRLGRYICNNFKHISAVLQANTEFVQFAVGCADAAPAGAWARRHERRARRNTSASVIPARRPRLPRHGPRASNSTAARFDGLAADGESLARPAVGPPPVRGAWPASQGRLRGEDIQFADLGEQVGDPLERCPEPDAPAPSEKNDLNDLSNARRRRQSTRHWWTSCSSASRRRESRTRKRGLACAQRAAQPRRAIRRNGHACARRGRAPATTGRRRSCAIRARAAAARRG